MTTNKIDVYSLGVMMWELATGELPWHGFTDLQLTMLVRAPVLSLCTFPDNPTLTSRRRLGRRASQGGAWAAALLLPAPCKFLPAPNAELGARDVRAHRCCGSSGRRWAAPGCAPS